MFSIFHKLGGEQAALDIITKRSGVAPSSEAVRGWKRLRRIPGSKAMWLVAECHERRVPVLIPQDFKAYDEAAQ